MCQILAVGSLFAVAPWSQASAQQAAQSEALETVVVTAQRIKDQLEAERDLTAGSVTVLDGADSYKRSVNNLADLLRYVPGVWSESRNGTDEVFYSSRGSNLDATDYDKNGIKMLQDGLPVTTADGNNHNRALDPLSARYATIAHGANALTYGASTLGGAIDFTSPTARNSAPLALFVSGGSFGQFSGRATAGASTQTLDGLVTVEAKNVDGYRDHGSQDSKGIYANAGWQSSDAVTTRVYATWLDNKQLLPGALTRAQYDADPNQANPSAINANYAKNVETWRLATKTTWSIDQHSSLDVGLSYEEQSLFHPIVDRIMIDFDGPGPAPPVEVFSLLIDTDHRDLGASLRYNLHVGAHDLLAGINFGDGAVTGGNYRNLGGRPNGLTEHVNNNADTLEAFLMDRWRLAPDWTLTYGLQVVDANRDVRTTNAISGEVRNPVGDYSAINPRIGIIRALSERNEFFASVSRLYEAPTTMELEDDVRGNSATLDAMHGTVYEMGLRGRTEAQAGVRWNWDVSVYYAQIRDEILSVDDPAAPGNSLATNIDRTTHAGIEALLGASFALGGAYSIEPLVSATLNDFSFDGDPVYGNNALPAAPAYAVRGEVMIRNAGGFYVGPTFDLVGERYADFSNSYRIGSHGLLGLRGGFSGSNWEAFAELRNLLDRKYVANVGVLDEAAPDATILYPGAPISAYAGVRLSF